MGSEKSCQYNARAKHFFSLASQDDEGIQVVPDVIVPGLTQALVVTCSLPASVVSSVETLLVLQVPYVIWSRDADRGRSHAQFVSCVYANDMSGISSNILLLTALQQLKHSRNGKKAKANKIFDAISLN
ncbi:hypothetical protein ElyMa_005476400 [Elysia marginata]|uniref:Receptor ligand binding region domain-containing protein n=1 Tax=Elysia marginata TaxID=1093978 RepID=A0AAV4EQR4_9GAST|nr:hypothetical protein ElyMa_005476400 [Elysia marginata]